MLRAYKFDFVTIRNLVDAADHAQDAGEAEDCERLLDKLADKIKEHNKAK